MSALEARRKQDRAARVNVNREWTMAMVDAAGEILPYGPDDEF